MRGLAGAKRARFDVGIVVTEVRICQGLCYENWDEDRERGMFGILSLHLSGFHLHLLVHFTKRCRMPSAM